MKCEVVMDTTQRIMTAFHWQIKVVSEQQIKTNIIDITTLHPYITQVRILANTYPNLGNKFLLQYSFRIIPIQ